MRLPATAAAADDVGVDGERGTSAVHRERSPRARLRSVIAGTLMGLLGLSALIWYYSGRIGHAAQTRASAQKLAAGRAGGEAPLPPLGRVDPPPAPAPALPRDVAVPGPALAPDASPPLAETATAGRTADGAPLLPYLAPGGATGSLYPSSYAPPPAKSPVELALERRLGGRVFGRRDEIVSSTGGGNPAPGPASGAESSVGAESSLRISHEREPGTSQDATPGPPPSGVAGAVQPRVLPTLRFLLPKGAFIDCTLETAIDSSLPGMTTCVTATDTFGADGTVVLLERGTKLVGETHGQVLQGATRVGVIWTEARTPAGVVVPLDSPATDELGRSGLPGVVNRHFWERFGAAILITTLEGAVQAAVQSASHGSGTVVYNPGPSEAIGTEVLKGTLSIPPTVVKAQGDRVQAIVARDIDFRSVYELRLAAPR